MFTYLRQMGLTQDGRGMKVYFLLLATRQLGTFAVNMDQVWVHTSHQGCLHHGPVLRVHVYIADITGTTGPYKTWGNRNSITCLHSFNHSFNKSVNLEM